MIILRPYETRFLVPVAASQWRAPSQAVPLDQMGNPCVQTRFRVRARAHDGGIAWQGWFDDREDCDAFLEAIAFGTLKYQRPLWDLPSPSWNPWLDGGLFYEFATVTFLTTTGSNQTYTKPADWNNADNFVECIGGGGGGGPATYGNGGGGGGYTKLANVTLTANATYRVGAGGGDSVAGGDSWFNDSAYPTTGSNKVGAKGGAGAQNAQLVSDGGAAASGYPSTGATRYSGGDGATWGSGLAGSGGGGAGGPGGNGGSGGTSESSTLGTNGGAGGGGTGGAGGTGSSTGVGGTGGNGTEWDSTHGSGGGGGGGKGSSTSYSGGPGGNYGGGGGGAGYPTGSAIGGSGKQGLIVVTYTPAAVTTSLVFDRYASFRHILVR